MMVSLRPLAFLSALRQPFSICTRRSNLSTLTSGAFLVSTSWILSSSPTRTSAQQPESVVSSRSASTVQSELSAAAMSSSSSSSNNVCNNDQQLSTGYLDAKSAFDLDQELMSQPGFSLEQLMELAGLSVAEAVYAVVPPPANILLVCGPGNNGGDGLVAARHLVLFGYSCTIVYPKQSKHPHFINLVKQCQDVGIPIVEEMPKRDQKYDAIVDAIFGFSFKGEPREPFAGILREIQQLQKTHDEGDPPARPTTTVLSVDVPSGWNVDQGDVSGLGFVPDVLISLTAPKLCAQNFHGRHFVGGRFLPPDLGAKYAVRMPNYPGVAQVVEVTTTGKIRTTTTTTRSNEQVSSSKNQDGGWEQGYAAYLAEKEAKEFAAYAKEKPSDETWEAQYAAYLAEKEASSSSTSPKL